MNGKFDIESIAKPTNKDITVAFSPSSNVKNYNYQIYKDNVLINSIDVSSSNISNFYFNETGVYKVVVNLNLVNGASEVLSSGEYVIDKKKPVITITGNDRNSLRCTVSDNYDKNISNKIVTNIDDIDFNKNGIQKYTCSVQDEAGNKAVSSVNINIVKPNSMIFIIQFLCVIAFIFIVIRIIHLFKVVKLEERLDKYTIKPLNKKEMSFFEKVSRVYRKILSSFGKKIEKFVFFEKYSKKLEKYSIVSPLYKNGFDIIAGKFIIAFLITLLALFSKALQFKILSFPEIVISLTLGFFTLDLYLFIKYKIFRWKLESDFIAAITIMNNAFKSGRSISQAIDIVSNEVDGVIGLEFKRMSMELLYGLNIETVFKRFAQRIDLEEANYLTASLTILSKTGGDIIKVFSSIERSMLDKRKLRLELKSLTSGSKIVVYVLLGIPFFFSFVISIINKDYFLPFINTSLGRILLIFMIIYYIIFVVVVKKIMRVVI